jgi:hypothetical protein
MTTDEIVEKLRKRAAYLRKCFHENPASMVCLADELDRQADEIEREDCPVEQTRVQPRVLVPGDDEGLCGEVIGQYQIGSVGREYQFLCALKAGHRGFHQILFTRQVKAGPVEQTEGRYKRWKERIDLAFTAGMLGMQHESLMGGRKLSAHEFITSLRVAMREAETEFMNTREAGPVEQAKCAYGGPFPGFDGEREHRGMLVEFRYRNEGKAVPTTKRSTDGKRFNVCANHIHLYAADPLFEVAPRTDSAEPK